MLKDQEKMAKVDRRRLIEFDAFKKERELQKPSIIEDINSLNTIDDSFARHFVIKELMRFLKQNEKEGHKLFVKECLIRHLVEVETSKWILDKMLKFFKDENLKYEEYEKIFYKIRGEYGIGYCIERIKSKKVLARMQKHPNTRGKWLAGLLEDAQNKILNTVDYMTSEE